MHMSNNYRLTINVLLGFGIVLSAACGKDATAPQMGVTKVTPTTMRIFTTTSGTDLDVDGYTVRVDGATIHLPANGSRIIEVTSGDKFVEFDAMSQNCTLDGQNPLPVRVYAGETTEVVFAIHCVAGGALDVTTTTSGVDVDGNGYDILLNLQGGASSANAHVAANGNATVDALIPGNYRLTLSDLAPNCDLVAGVPQIITVTAGSATPASVDVTCVAPAQLAFVSGSGLGADIYLVNSNGTGIQRLTSTPGEDVDPAWSPDGKRIAFASARNGQRNIYVMDANGDNVVRLTNSPGDYLPAWSPDGTRLAFVSDRDGNTEIYVMNSDGTNQSRLTNDNALDTDPAWSPDGNRIAFRSKRTGNGDIYVMNNDGSGITQLTQNLYPDMQPSWSPDGKRIVFAAGVSGDIYNDDDVIRDIYIMNADGSGARSLLSDVSGDRAHPIWSPDGRKIAFAADGCSVWDYGDCPTVLQIVTVDGVPYSLTVTDASEPAWRP